MPGTLALIGMSDLGYVSIGRDQGRTPTFEIERFLFKQAGTHEVLYVPTASVEWDPVHRKELVRRAVDVLADRLQANMVVPEVWERAAAFDPDIVPMAERAHYIYLGGGRPGPLAAALRETPLWATITQRWQQGAVLAGESAGSVVLTDRVLSGDADNDFAWQPGGLGLLPGLRVVPHSDTGKGQSILAATLAETPPDIPVVAIPEFTAVVRDGDGTWYQIGEGGVVVFFDGTSLQLEALNNITPRDFLDEGCLG